MDNESLTSKQEMAFLDSLASLLNLAPQQPKMLNIKRMAELLDAKCALEDIVRQNGDAPQVEINLSPEFNMASISIKADDFVVRDWTAFNRATATASNIEVYPLTTGQLRCAIAYKNVFITL